MLLSVSTALRQSRGLFAAAFLLLLTACSGEQVYQQESYVFGTRVQISIYGLDDAVAAKHAGVVLAELDRLHRKLHAWQPSEITRLNAAFKQGETVEADIELIAMLNAAQKYARQSDQLFNPAVGALVNVWGFHKDTFAAVTPDANVISALLAAQPSMDNVLIDGANVSSTNPAVELDLGGFAKGWALDHSADYLRKQRVFNALINIGGNVLALGKKGQEPWTVGIQHPREPEAMATLALKDGESIGTSGDYQRFFMLNGKRYSHLIDPRTGQPAQGVQAVTIVAPPSQNAGAISDVATKPMFIGGVNTSWVYAQRFGVNDAMVINDAGAVFISPSLQSRIKWLKKPAHLYRLR
ncbi:FAD:protein FMN transferase [Chitinibacter bivalviorum]|uniref:FAD:protein FMN transferase n=1 Tax=Chitinibacter bivalviorum TaxID=2739434 RepID=A0A7H9BM15_9NEIS|nr:FAD:protein FMN transferase [Chitinibacter bivalviorum]QLG89121.1 FAD:protein FMN transferase [Chitinibacter bivalviorum]